VPVVPVDTTPADVAKELTQLQSNAALREHARTRKIFTQMQPAPMRSRDNFLTLNPVEASSPVQPSFPEDSIQTSTPAAPIPTPSIPAPSHPPLPVSEPVERPAILTKIQEPASNPIAEMDKNLYQQPKVGLSTSDKIKMTVPFITPLLTLQWNLFMGYKARFYKALAKLLRDNKALVLQGNGEVVRQIIRVPNLDDTTLANAKTMFSSLGLGSLFAFVKNNAFQSILEDRKKASDKTSAALELKSALDDVDAAFKMILMNVMDMDIQDTLSIREEVENSGNMEAEIYFTNLIHPVFGGTNPRRKRPRRHDASKSRNFYRVKR